MADPYARNAMTLGQLRIEGHRLGLVNMHQMSRAALVRAIVNAERRALRNEAKRTHAAAISRIIGEASNA